MRAHRLICLVPAAALLMLAACSKSTPPTTDAGSEGAPAAQSSAADLAAREAELKQREQELASREAALAESQSQGAKQGPVASAPRPAPKPAPVSKPAPAPVAAKPAPTPPPQPLIVPEGTQLSLALSEDVSTKNAKVGDTIRATVVSDVRVDGQSRHRSGHHRGRPGHGRGFRQQQDRRRAQAWHQLRSTGTARQSRRTDQWRDHASGARATTRATR